VNKFIRSSRWRRAFFAACLPYILVSVFVESLHTGPAAGTATLAAQASIIASDAGALRVQAPGTEESCPACNWLRLGRRVENPVGLVRTEDLVLEASPPFIALYPSSPVPHPALFRGPPRRVLA
jgi:hypothetical protein